MLILIGFCLIRAILISLYGSSKFLSCANLSLISEKFLFDLRNVPYFYLYLIINILWSINSLNELLLFTDRFYTKS
jgi:hypothetical protein